MSDYASDHLYKKVNGALRGDNDFDDESLAVVDSMDEAFDQHSISSNSVVVYRGLKRTSRLFDDLRVTGTLIDDQAFVSTSISRETARGFAKSQGAIIHLKTNQDTQVIAGANLEDELILNRGTTFRVISSEIDNQGYVQVNAEVV